MKLTLHHLRVPQPSPSAYMTMKIATLLVPVLFAAAILAESMQKWKELYRTEELKKFTSNGTKFSEMWSDCSSSDDSVKILSLSVTPDPPEKGQRVTADIQLQFTEEVEAGSLSFVIKYLNYFPVMDKKKDLCNIPNILRDPCPLKEGVHEATLAETFPSYAPSGQYIGKVVAKDKSGNQLMCIKLDFSV